MRREKQLVAAGYPWDQRLGDGDTPSSYLALVAWCEGRRVGQIGAGPPGLKPEAILRDRTGGALLRRDPPWWKIHSLAVDPSHQGTGVGTALLQAVVERLPRDIVGIYGSVELDRPQAIAWYRRRGFYLAANASLPLSQRSTTGIQLLSVPDQVFFYRRGAELHQHLAGKGYSNFERRIAREEYRRELRMHGRLMPARGDLGYRQLASRIAQAPPEAACPHVWLGPRVLVVDAWDPNLTRVCVPCHPRHLETIAVYDASDHCDGCQRTKPDVELSWAGNEDGLLFVTAGLCASCRADLPPAGANRRPSGWFLGSGRA
jgi:GNAT superfamily N-acetyltransferase